MKMKAYRSVLKLVLALLLFTLLPRQAQADFTASVGYGDLGEVNLTVPTTRGYFYQIETSTNCQVWNPAPGGVFYGSGNPMTYFLLDPPPPPAASPGGNGGGGSPTPPKPSKLIFYELWVNGQGAVLSSWMGGTSWSVAIPEVFPHDASRTVSLYVQDAMCRWSLDVMVINVAAQNLPAVPQNQNWTPEMIQARDIMLAHKADLMGQLAYLAALGPLPTPPPSPGGGRLLFRVRQEEIDSNHNSLPDWWEWRNQYGAFAAATEATYADPTADDDGDGLNNAQELAAGSNPRKKDTDGDGSPDGMDTDATNANVHPPLLSMYQRNLGYYYVDSEDPYGSMTATAWWDLTLGGWNLDPGLYTRTTITNALDLEVPYPERPDSKTDRGLVHRLAGAWTNTTDSYTPPNPTYICTLEQSKVWLVERPARNKRKPNDPLLWNDNAPIKKSLLKVTELLAGPENAVPTRTLTFANVDLTIPGGAEVSSTAVTDLLTFNSPAASEVAHAWLGYPELAEAAPETGFDFFERYLPAQNLERPWLMVPLGATNHTKITWTDHPLGPFDLSIEDGPGLEVTPTSMNLGNTMEVFGPDVEGEEGKPALLKVGTQNAQATLLNLYPAHKLTVKVRVWNISFDNDDVDSNQIRLNEGKPNSICIQKAPGSGILRTDTPAGDDVIADGVVKTGRDGIRQTTAAEGDVWLFDIDKGEKNAPFISAGPNGVLNSPLNSKDAIVGNEITTGADGIRQSPLIVPHLANDVDPATLGLQAYLNAVYGKQMNVEFEIYYSNGSVGGEVAATAPRDEIGNAANVLLDNRAVGLNGTFDVWSHELGARTSEEEQLYDKGYMDPAALFDIYFVPLEVAAVVRPFGTRRLAKGYTRAVKNLRRAYFGKGLYTSASADRRWVVAHEIGHLGGLTHCLNPEINVQTLEEKLVPIKFGFPLLNDQENFKRLMMGGDREKPINPATGRQHTLLIKDEWEVFRKTVINALESENPKTSNPP